MPNEPYEPDYREQIYQALSQEKTGKAKKKRGRQDSDYDMTYNLDDVSTDEEDSNMYAKTGHERKA